MAQATTVTLLPQTAFNAVATVTGNAQPAAAYYLAYQDLQTITWNVGGSVANQFSGTITIQASLADTPGDSDWFSVFNLPLTNASQSSFTNIQGNFIWIRALITSFSQGVINSIKASY